MVSVLLLALLGCEGELPPGQCENADLIESWIDADLDGFGDPGTRELVCQLRDGLVQNKDDCDDQRSNVHPDALEACDGIDNNCDGEVDEGQRELDYYQDLDGDGFGSYEETTEACTPPPGYVENFDDCDDLNAQVNPLAREICNGGTDDNCNGRADDDDPTLDRTTATDWYYDRDDDGYGGTLDLPFTEKALEVTGLTNPFPSCIRPVLPQQLQGIPGTFVGNVEDCDDTNPAVSPDGVETCNLIDDDCDGLIDDSDPDLDPAELITFYADDDLDGAGDPSRPTDACFQPWFTSFNSDDCDDTNPYLQGPTGWWIDGDGDGFGAGDLSSPVCNAPGADYVLPALGEDCNDGEIDDYPGAPEVCDARDNDCDGFVDVADEDLDVYTAVPVWRDLDMDGFGDADGQALACEGVGLPGYVDNDGDCDDRNDLVAPDAIEACNGIDDDCDELIDTADLDVDLSTAPTWYADFDEDGWGNASLPVVSCEQPNFYVGNDLDCDDSDELSGAEVEWWSDVDGDGFGAGAKVGPQCDSPGGSAVPAIHPEDCDDDALAVYPGAPDECGDGIDSDCNGDDGGELGCLSDTCAEATAAEALEVGTQVYAVSLGAYEDNLGNPTCVTGTGATGDAILPVNLQSGKSLRATVTSDDDTYIALFSSCNVAGSCLFGGDAIESGAEQIVYENQGSDLEAYLVVGCAAPGGCGDVVVEASIIEEQSWRADACPASSVPVLTTGGYGFLGNYSSLNNQLDIGFMCTGSPTGDPDATFRVQLQPGERLYADTTTGDSPFYFYYYYYYYYYYLFGEVQLYLTEDCNDGSTCVAGDAGQSPQITYTNTSGSVETHYLTYECNPGYYYDTCSDLELQVVIE